MGRKTKNRPAGMNRHVPTGVDAALIAVIKQQIIGRALALNAVSLINAGAGYIRTWYNLIETECRTRIPIGEAL